MILKHILEYYLYILLYGINNDYILYDAM